MMGLADEDMRVTIKGRLMAVIHSTERCEVCGNEASSTSNQLRISPLLPTELPEHFQHQPQSVKPLSHTIQAQSTRAFRGA